MWWHRTLWQTEHCRQWFFLAPNKPDIEVWKDNEKLMSGRGRVNSENNLLCATVEIYLECLHDSLADIKIRIGIELISELA